MEWLNLAWEHGPYYQTKRFDRYNQVIDEMIEQGLSETEAKKHFYLVDKQGLLFEDTEGLTPEQIPFVRKRDEFENSDELITLEAAVKAINQQF